MSELKFEIIKEEELDECGEIVARAFENYEYISNYISNSEKRKKFVSVCMPIELKVNKRAIRFVAKEGGTSVAVATLFPPGVSRVNDIEYIKAGFAKAFVYGGVIDVNAWVNMDKKASAPCHSLDKDVWYLNLITVDPSCQGRGIGSRFINECIVPYVREHGGKKLSLFTNSEINKTFYFKNKFEEFDYREFFYKRRRLPSYSLIRDL